VENQFSLQVNVFGSLREAQFVCPSHTVTLASSSDETVITLTEAKAVMDRDFILTVKAPQATHSFAICGADDDGAAAIASFQPLFPGLRQPRALELAIVIDCSGSMQGDSIAQARQALAGILDALQPRDHVTVVAFGSTTKRLSDRLLPCTPANLGKARQFADELKADMGGTEIGPALQTAYAAASGSESGDVFVVTDGEVSSWKAIVAEAKRSGWRVFTVGVGSAVSEAVADRHCGRRRMSWYHARGTADRVIRPFEACGAPRAKGSPSTACGRAISRQPLGAVFEAILDRLGAVRPSINYRPRHARNRNGRRRCVPATAGGDAAPRIRGPNVNGGAARRIGTAEGNGSRRGPRAGASLSTRKTLEQMAHRGREA
jgi:Ca-activated chloride channel family protein